MRWEYVMIVRVIIGSCPDGCNRTLKCGHKIHTHSTFVEGPEELVTCKECGKKETIYYMWYGLSMTEHYKKYGD